MHMQRMQYANWGLGEFLRASRAVITGRIAAGPEPQRLASQLRQLVRAFGVYPVNAGRTAIFLALRVMREVAPSRNRVIVPAYICPGVTSAVQRADLVCVPAAIGGDLNIDPRAVESLLDDKTLAVIVPHMYGCPADIEAIEQACASASVFVIDDAAQIVGIKCGPRVLGGCGDIGIHSFAQSKAIVTGVRGSGGMLMVNNPVFDGRVKALWDELPQAQGRLVQLAFFIGNYLVSSRYGMLKYYIARFATKFARWAASDAYFEPARMSNLDASIAAAQLHRLERLRQEKVRVAALYAKFLLGIEGVSFPQFAPGRFLTRVMVGLPANVDVEAVRRSLGRAGIFTRPGYPALASTVESTRKSIQWAQRLIELPSRVNMTEADVREVCQALRESLQLGIDE